MGKNYNSDEIEKLADYLDVKNFRNNPMVNSSELRACGIIKPGVFVRKGKSGAWRETFTEELEASADAWIDENLRDTDFRFPYIASENNNDGDSIPTICRDDDEYKRMIIR